MQETDPTYAQGDAKSPSPIIFRLFLFVGLGLLVVLLVAMVPSLISVNRLQRRIATNITPHSAASRPQIGDTLTLASVETSIK